MESKKLSVGDALTIFLLLAFAIGWLPLIGWFWGEPDEEVEIDFLAGLIILGTMFAPSFYALWLVGEIVKKAIGYDVK